MQSCLNGAAQAPMCAAVVAKEAAELHEGAQELSMQPPSRLPPTQAAVYNTVQAAEQLYYPLYSASQCDGGSKAAEGRKVYPERGGHCTCHDNHLTGSGSPRCR